MTNPNRTPTKSSGDSLLRVNRSTLLGVLSTSSPNLLSSVLAMFRAKGFFEVALTHPYQLRVEFLIPNHTKSNLELVKRILQLSNFQSGKYVLNLIDFALSTLVFKPTEPNSGSKHSNFDSGRKSSKNLPFQNLVPEQNLAILKTNKIILNRSIIDKGCETMNAALLTLKSLKDQGILDYEVDDELFFFRPKEAMSDVDIYSLIAERKNQEDLEIKNVTIMDPCLQVRLTRCTP